MISNKTVNLTVPEANLASLSIAIVCGSLAGNLCTLLPSTFSPFWFLLSIIAALGYAISHFVCKYFFKSAHIWYGQFSLNHRIYDVVAMISALVSFYV